jgi:hypothetical protein
MSARLSYKGLAAGYIFFDYHVDFAVPFECLIPLSHSDRLDILQTTRYLEVAHFHAFWMNSTKHMLIRDSSL